MNTTLLHFVGDYFSEEIDSILLNSIHPRLQSIEKSSDLYQIDDKWAVYDYITHLSFIKQNDDMKIKLGRLQDLFTIGTNVDFINLAKEIIETSRR